MFDFNRVNPSVNLTAEWILSKVDEVAIFSYYFQPFQLGKAYCSKLTKDRNPSASLYVSNSGRVKYKDYRQKGTLNCFEYVMKAHGCNFLQALNIIAQDFGLIDRKTRKVSQEILESGEKIDKEAKKQTLIQFKPSNWQQHHLDYWKQYEITPAELYTENVFPIADLWINKSYIPNFNNELRFAYPEKWIDVNEEENEGVKIYSPYSAKMKWISSIPLSVPFGLNRLPLIDDLLIITKGVKDLIVLKKLFPAVIATQNESESSLPDWLQMDLLSRFKNCIIFWDNDPVGVEACQSFNNRGFGYFNIPNEDRVKYGCKDASDVVKAFGLDYLKHLLQKKQLI